MVGSLLVIGMWLVLLDGYLVMDWYLLAGFLLGLSVGCVVTFAVCMYAAQRWLLEQRDHLLGLKEIYPAKSFPVESVGKVES